MTMSAAELWRQRSHVDPDDNPALALRLDQTVEGLDALATEAYRLALAIADAYAAGDAARLDDLRGQQTRNTTRWVALHG